MPEEKEAGKEDAKPEVKALPVEEGVGSLDAFLAPPSPAKPEGEGKEEVKEAAKDDTKAEEKKPEGDGKPEEKASPEPDKKPDEKLDPDKDKKPEEKPEEKPKVDYESDDNPYKKRYRDTSSWATSLNQKQKTHDREILILQKKADGTYDEERDNPKRTEEQIETEAAARGRSIASRDAAISMWGEDVVEKDLTAFNEIFKDDVYMLGSVASADQPVVEAIRALRRYEFHKEYGDDPVEIIKKVGEKAVKGAGEKIQSDEAAKLAARVKVEGEEAKGLAGLAAKGSERVSAEPAKVVPLKDVFDN